MVKPKTPPEGALAEIVALARRQLDLEGMIADMEASLKDLNEQLRAVSQEDLPNAMAEAGLTMFTLDTGQLIEVKHDFDVGIPTPLRDQAYAWFETNEYGGMIKTVVAVQFGKGELEKAMALFEALQKKKLAAVIKRDIPWQTLKAFVVESARMEPPRQIPSDLLGVHPVNKSIIKMPKAKK